MTIAMGSSFFYLCCHQLLFIRGIFRCRLQFNRISSTVEETEFQEIIFFYRFYC